MPKRIEYFVDGKWQELKQFLVSGLSPEWQRIQAYRNYKWRYYERTNQEKHR